MKKIILILVAFYLFIGCRGKLSNKEPVHLNPNMDFQSKFTAQDKVRKYPEGVVPFGKANVGSFYSGKDDAGNYVNKIPVEEVNTEFLLRGQERFNIYCSVCHGMTGAGDGTVIERNVGIPKPSSFYDERLKKEKDGYFFHVISKGIRNMKGYERQIPEEDRWAIVAYLRSLQKRVISVDDLTEEQADKLVEATEMEEDEETEEDEEIEESEEELEEETEE